jgi:hypothetical protein
MNTKHKGDIALTQAIAFFTRHGYEVLLPIGDKRDYDCVVEKEGALQKVQVKFAGMYNDGACKVSLRVAGGNQSRNYVKKYSKEAFDILFVYTESGFSYQVPWKEIQETNQLTIDDKKYIKYRVF